MRDGSEAFSFFVCFFFLLKPLEAQASVRPGRKPIRGVRGAISGRHRAVDSHSIILAC